jgi:hypothetical protein
MFPLQRTDTHLVYYIRGMIIYKLYVEEEYFNRR